jgi:D-alanyl-D-alanine carboxypeptidase (penicillin-binding protein 5/6)
LRHFLNSLIAIAAILLLGATVARAQAFETPADTAYMVDVGSGTVLFSKAADRRIPPASLAKLMTVAYVLDEVKARNLSLSDSFAVSENAWRTGGAPSRTSTMFAELNSTIAVEDLLRGVIVQAANDGCIVLAEGIAGSEAAFVELLNERAREIGLADSVFVNSTGLPAEGQHTTMRDMVVLAAHIAREHPRHYRMFAEPNFTWNGIFQRNRNPLLGLDIGADGLAVGFSDEGGFGIVGSVWRDGRRLVAAMSGLSTDNQRRDEARRMLDWGIKGFETNALFDRGQVVGEARLFGGDKAAIALRAEGPVTLLMPVDNRERVTARIVYQGPVRAPVEEGAPVGVLRVWVGEALSQETPLYAAESVGTGSLTQRATDAAVELLTGWIRLL